MDRAGLRAPGRQNERENSTSKKEGTMSQKPLTVIAVLKAKPGKEEALKQAITACIAPTRAEEGCINYDLHQSLDNRTVFTLYENWRSKQDLDQHLQMPYLQDLLGRADELFAEPPDIQLLERIC
jgi:quinol monooxygenase YgiN